MRCPSNSEIARISIFSIQFAGFSSKTNFSNLTCKTFIKPSQKKPPHAHSFVIGPAVIKHTHTPHFFARGPAVRATDVHIIRGRTGKRTTAPTMPKHLLKIKHGETLRRISLDAIMTHEAL
jgi:hypothetical protein